jgi:hypothetical protein
MRRRRIRRRRLRHSHRITRVKLPRYVQKAMHCAKEFKSTRSLIDAVVQRGRRQESGRSNTAKLAHSSSCSLTLALTIMTLQ